MKFKYIIIFLAFVNASCTKFIDQQPVSSAADETTWKTDDDANSAVAACYSLTRAALNASVSYYAYGDLPSDEFANVLDGDFLQIRNINWAISVSNLNVWDPKLKLRVYTPFYSAIQQSNRCLHFLNEMPLSAFSGDDEKSEEARRNKYLAEAYFTRAFNYFYISRVWGDVPLDTSYQADISNFNGIARTPQKNVLASCIADLNIAKKYLDWKDASSIDRVVRADKGAVFALMAHIYAWQGDYDSCRMACDSVINSGTYSLVPGSSYASIYDGQSDEGIFEIAQSASAEGMNALAYSAGIANYVLASPYIPNTIPTWQINESVFQQLYSDTNDVRLKQFPVVTTGTENYYLCTKYSNLQKVTTANSGNYYILRNNIIIFRLADILLLKAEAQAAQVSPDFAGSLSLINQVRSRAGAAEIQSVPDLTTLLNTITAERGRELFLEGHRYYDLVRNERLTGESQFINSDGGQSISQTQFIQGKYYWPLDPSLFTLNPLLTQTPFWRTLLTH